MTPTFARLTMVVLVMSGIKHFAIADRVKINTQGVGDISSRPSRDAGDVMPQTSPVFDPGQTIAGIEFSGSLISEATEQLKLVTEHYESITGSLTDAAKIASAAKIVSLAKSISTVLAVSTGMLSAFGAIFSLLAAIILPSTEDIIREQFEKTNQKLDAITQQIRNMRTDILTSTEFHTWFSTFTEWEFTIRNGEEKLVDTMTQMKQLTDERTKLKVAKAFVDYYREQDVEGATKNILRLTTENKESETRPNILRLFAQEKDCDTKDLSLLMIVIIDIILSSAKQTYAYALLTYNTPSLVDQQVQSMYQQLYQSRKEFEDLLWTCFENTVENAQVRVKNAMALDPEASGYPLTTKIHEDLHRKAPWYNWAVVQYNKAFRVDILICHPADLGSNRVNLTLHDKGHQFFIVSENGRNILVLWQDEEDKNQVCRISDTARTFIPFQLCEGCNSDTIRNDIGFTTGINCLEYFISYIDEEASSCREYREVDARYLIKEESLSYIAGGFKAQPDPCEGQGCSGHGKCRSVPDTGLHMCLCEPYYVGPSCENYTDPRAVARVAELMADLRGNFGSFIGVPDIIDVYLELQQLPKLLQAIHQDIMSSIEFNGILTYYGKDFSDGEYIADTYNKLLLQNIKEEKFYQIIEPLDFNFHRFFWSLAKMIRGDGYLIKEDLLEHYKKSKTQAAACSQSYSTRVTTYMMTILKLDQVVSEAQVRLLLREAKQVAALGDQQNILDQITDVVSATKERQHEYVQHWANSSCPRLTDDEDMDEKFCDENSSYYGQEVTIHCRNFKKPTTESVSCRREKGQLVWSAVPRCEYMWSPWGSWSECSKTCGSGIKTRTRRKPMGETQTSSSSLVPSDEATQEEREECNTQDCCQARYGKFKCSDNSCISQANVCDGLDHCGNGDDESKSRCSYLRVGDRMVLKSRCRGKCLSGYADGLDNWYYMQMRGCPRDVNDWYRCAYEIMQRIDAHWRSEGEAIRYGDEVMIKFTTTDGIDYWIQHDGKWTTIDDGPDSTPDIWFKWIVPENKRFIFKIFALDREGKCSGDMASSCIGKPIQPGDYIYLRSSKGSDLSVDSDGWVRWYNCVGSTLNSADLTSCNCEMWELFLDR